MRPSRHFLPEYENHDTLKNAADGAFAVILDTTMTTEIAQGYYTREFLNKVQMLRKDNNLELDADIDIFYQADTPDLLEAINIHYQNMKDKLKKRFINADLKPHGYPEIASTNFKILNETGKIFICSVGISFNRVNVLKKVENHGGE